MKPFTRTYEPIHTHLSIYNFQIQQEAKYPRRWLLMTHQCSFARFGHLIMLVARGTEAMNVSKELKM